MRFIALLAATFIMWTNPALAQECVPEFVDSAKTVTVSDVEVGIREVSRENFQIRVRNKGTGACSATIRFARVDGFASPDRLEYTLRSGSSALQVLPNEAAAATSESELFVGGLPSGNRGSAVPFLLSIPSEWGIAAGFRTDQLQLTLLDSTGQVTDSLFLTINVTVPPSVSLRVVGATGTNRIATINLGNITSRDVSTSDPFGIRVWSTSAYSVSFESENGGNLLHEDGRDTIPYELRMDRQLVNLSGSGEFVFPERTSSLGRVHRLRVQAGPAIGRAGGYGDRVTVTVSAV